ncbi:MAG: ATP-binding protein [Alphaproteobacteria bacterium]|nr:ATP-binding protein [Alphaproteobacteria bacterium]MBU0799227.1 ATP-binding protein [Alphaproteobacteria bacterium]MBU0887522.1 ATP-binding protein [Alphaproteobacteria bacterium]MBU1814759.1 ATP-binding protein [Alphaproteobacteria bacterium]
MARSHHLPPSAASLTASLRDLGYSLETAVADLIDNSISADATSIQIFCDMSRSEPVVVIADNGSGMTEDEVIAAMRHGATDPRKERGPKDLGRFGLGLKTASFSQCRRLTVVSAVKGHRAGAEWSLAQIEEDDDWFISVLEPDEIAEQPFVETLCETGTLVIWRDLDRLFEDETGQKRDEIVNEKLAVVEKHLSLVFHRFLAGEVKGRRRLSIYMNGHPITAFDPFCRKNEATQVLHEEKVWIGDVPVVMQPYILPHHSRLSASEYDYYQSRSDFISNQGAYVYRNGRLMAWGDWFRLVPKGEATKLARVQIDFPNNLDEAWTIDIKKSRARPPHAVRERLRQIISQIIARSVTVHRGRGQKLFQESQAPLWERYADHGGIRFVINAEHPLVASLCTKLSSDDATSLRVLLDSISAALPVEMIYSDYSTHPREVSQTAADHDQALDRLRSLKQLLYGDGPGDPQAFLRIVLSTHLFDGQIEMTEKFIAEAFA